MFNIKNIFHIRELFKNTASEDIDQHDVDLTDTGVQRELSDKQDIRYKRYKAMFCETALYKNKFAANSKM